MKTAAIDQKYITFKRQDFYEMMGELGLPPWSDGKGPDVGGDLDCAVLSERITQVAEERCIKDVIGLRLQDMFTSTALHAYVNAVQNAIEVLEHINAPVPEHLYSVRDYFHDLAIDSDSAPTKMPD